MAVVTRLSVGTEFKANYASNQTDFTISNASGVNITTTGADVYVVVAIEAYWTSSATIAYTDVRFNGQSMTAVGPMYGTDDMPATNTGYTQHFILQNPTAVTNATIAIDVDRTSFSTPYFSVNSAVYRHVGSIVTPPVVGRGSSGTVMSLDVPSTDDGRMILAIMHHEPAVGDLVPWDENQTKISDLRTTTTAGKAIWCEALGAPTTTTFSATKGTGSPYAINAFSMLPVGIPLGTAGGGYSYSGTVSGKRTPKGTADLSYAWTATVTGKETPKGSVSRAYTWAGTATGLAGKPNGVANGSYTWSSTRTGKRVPKGSATLGYTWAGLGNVTGKRVAKGTASPGYNWTATRTGKRTPKGSATLTYGWSGTPVALRKSYGAAGGPTEVFRRAVGTPYSVNIPSNSTDGSITFAAVDPPPPGMNGAVVVSAIVFKSSNATLDLAATYNGQPMIPFGTPTGSAGMTVSNTGYQQQFIILNPPANVGASEVLISYDRTGFATLDFAFNSASYVNAGAYSGPVTAGSNVSSGTTLSLTVPSAADGRMILAILGSEPVSGDFIVSNPNYPIISELRTPAIPGKAIWVEADPVTTSTVFTGTRGESHDWYAGAITITPTAMITLAPGLGGYGWGGAASGSRNGGGIIVGAAYQFALTVDTKRFPKGTAGTRNYTWAGSAVGRQANRGTAGGAYTWAQTTTGKKFPKGNGGTRAWTYASAGVTGVSSTGGTAAGSFTWSGAVTGKRVPKATTLFAYGWVAAATGKKIQRGDANTVNKATDPKLQNPAYWLTGYTATIALVDVSGETAIKMTQSASPNYGGVGVVRNLSGSGIAVDGVVAGQTWTLRGKLRGDAANSPTARNFFQISKSKTGQTSSHPTSGSSFIAPSGAWVEQTVTTTIDAIYDGGAISPAVYNWLDNPIGTVVYIKDVELLLHADPTGHVWGWGGFSAGKRTARGTVGGTYTWAGTVTGKRKPKGGNPVNRATDPDFSDPALWKLASNSASVAITTETGEKAIKLTQTIANYGAVTMVRNRGTGGDSGFAANPGDLYLVRAKVRTPASNTGTEAVYVQMSVTGSGQTSLTYTSALFSGTPDDTWVELQATTPIPIPSGYANVTAYAAVFNNTTAIGNVVHVKDIQFLRLSDAPTYGWDAVVTGSETPKGSVSRAYTWAGTVTGKKIQKGVSAGAYTWAGAAAGKETPKGSATLPYRFPGTSTGKRSPKGSGGTNGYTFAGGAFGAMTPSSYVFGGFSYVAGSVIGKRRPKAVVGVTQYASDRDPINPSLWTSTSSGSISLNTSDLGEPAVKVTQTASPAYSEAGFVRVAAGNSTSLAVTPGQQWILKARIRTPAANVGEDRVMLQMRVTGTGGPLYLESGYFTLTDDTWTTLVATATIPAGYNTMYPAAYFFLNTLVGNVFYVKEMDVLLNVVGVADYGWSATAVGKETPKGSAGTRAYTWSGAAVGRMPKKGTAGGSYNFAGAGSTGKRIQSGQAVAGFLDQAQDKWLRNPSYWNYTASNSQVETTTELDGQIAIKLTSLSNTTYNGVVFKRTNNGNVDNTPAGTEFIARAKMYVPGTNTGAEKRVFIQVNVSNPADTTTYPTQFPGSGVQLNTPDTWVTREVRTTVPTGYTRLYAQAYQMLGNDAGNTLYLREMEFLVATGVGTFGWSGGASGKRPAKGSAFPAYQFGATSSPNRAFDFDVVNPAVWVNTTTSAVSISTDYAYRGFTSAKVVKTAATGGSSNWCFLAGSTNSNNGSGWAVSPGERVHGQFMVFRPTGQHASAIATVRFQDSTGTLPLSDVGITHTLTENAWTSISSTAVCPPGYDRATIYYSVGSAAATGNVHYIDQVIATSDPDLAGDGGVETAARWTAGRDTSRTTRVTTGPIHSGAAAMEHIPTAGTGAEAWTYITRAPTGGAEFRVPSVIGDRFLYEGWVWVDPANGYGPGAVIMQTQVNDASNVRISNGTSIATVTLANAAPGWNRFIVPFTNTVAGSATIIPYISVTGNTTTSYVRSDDFRVIKLGSDAYGMEQPKGATGRQIAIDGTFEGGANVGTVESTAIVRTSVAARTGTRGIRLTPAAGVDANLTPLLEGNVSQVITVTPGEKFDVEFWYKTPANGASVSASPHAAIRDATTQVYSYPTLPAGQITNLAPNSPFQRYRTTYTVPANVDRVRFTVQLGQTFAGNVMDVDDFLVVKYETPGFGWSGTATGAAQRMGSVGVVNYASDPTLRNPNLWATGANGTTQLTSELGVPAVKLTANHTVGVTYPAIPFVKNADGTAVVNMPATPGQMWALQGYLRTPASNPPGESVFLQFALTGSGQTNLFFNTAVTVPADDTWTYFRAVGVVPAGYTTLNSPYAYLNTSSPVGSVMYAKDMRLLLDIPGVAEYRWSGAATGKRTPKATIANAPYRFPITSAVGSRRPKGSATLPYKFPGTAAGKRKPRGFTTMQYLFGSTLVSGKWFPKGRATFLYGWFAKVISLEPIRGAWDNSWHSVPPPQKICSDDQLFTLRTYDGIQLHQFPPTQQLNWKWTRESRETSVCELAVPTTLAYDQLPGITPWLHWLDCWDETGRELYWSGPIVRASANRDRLAISARDLSSLTARTRCPIEKRWDSAYPEDIADEMYRAMIEHHNLNVRPIVLPNPRGDRFDFATQADKGDMDVQMSHLSDLGLKWTVVAGVPIFGPVSLKSQVALGAEHFIDGNFEVVRDGANFCNDVVLRAAGAKSYGSVEAGGLKFQKTITIDSISGVPNADRAAQQFVQYAGRMRDQVTMPDGAVLHPEAPLTLKQLMPSARIVVDVYGLLTMMEVMQVSVTRSSGLAQVAVKLESVNDELPDLILIQSGGQL